MPIVGIVIEGVFHLGFVGLSAWLWCCSQLRWINLWDNEYTMAIFIGDVRTGSLTSRKGHGPLGVACRWLGIVDVVDSKVAVVRVSRPEWHSCYSGIDGRLIHIHSSLGVGGVV